jgi:ATP-dependent RNA helicase DeaD
MTNEPQPQPDEAATPTPQPEAQYPDFSFTDLPEPYRGTVARIGWTTPTPVQERAIPYLLSGRDLIVQAKTGSGKTAAYLLPLLQSLRPDDFWCQALVLAPTRELARQVHAVLCDLIEGTGIRTALVYGGVGYGEQNDRLRGGAQVVVGTPGRILDHLARGTFTLQRLTWLILDEADELLSMGFYPALRKLRRQLPAARQTCLLSATIPYHVEELAHSFLRDPDRLIMSRGDEVVSTLEHCYYIVPPLQKDRMLIRLIEMENPDAAIIFCNTKREVEYLAAVLRNNGFDAAPLTGDLAQGARERIVQRMRDGALRFLIATDVVARGIDISDLSHVFLYDIPEHTEIYVHRSGRTARAGKTGIAVTLCESIEERKLLTIAQQYHFDITKRELPSTEDVAARLFERLIAYLEGARMELSIQDRERVDQFLPMVASLASEEDTQPLLALLLDRAYIQSVHQPTFVPEPARAQQRDDGPPREGKPRDSKPRKRGGRGRSRSGRDGGYGGDAGAAAGDAPPSGGDGPSEG